MATKDYILLLGEAVRCSKEGEGITSDLDALEVAARRKRRWARLKKEVPNLYPAAMKAANYLTAMVMSMENESL